LQETEDYLKQMVNMFFFFDSDDLMNSNCLTELFNRAETLNLDIALCGYDLVDEHGKILKRYCENYEYIKKIIEGKEAIHRLLRKEISICIGSQLLRKEFIENKQLLFTPGATHGEDQEFTLKALCFAKRYHMLQNPWSNMFEEKILQLRKRV